MNVFKDPTTFQASSVYKQAMELTSCGGSPLLVIDPSDTSLILTEDRQASEMSRSGYMSNE